MSRFVGVILVFVAVLALISARSTLQDIQDLHMGDEHGVTGEYTSRVVFKLHDKDGDDSLNVQELLTLYSPHYSHDSHDEHEEDLENSPSKYLVDSLLENFDKNKDGVLSWIEYLSAVDPEEAKREMENERAEKLREFKESAKRYQQREAEYEEQTQNNDDINERKEYEELQQRIHTLRTHMEKRRNNKNDKYDKYQKPQGRDSKVFKTTHTTPQHQQQQQHYQQQYQQQKPKHESFAKKEPEPEQSNPKKIPNKFKKVL